MSLSSGTRLGPYEILTPIGAGGMGEVYRARDPRLKRDIAIKVLPETTVADPERRARLEREAQSIAGLSHPNIVTIYSVEDIDGVLCLTMEYVDGQPLSDLIVKGGLPLPQILTLAIPLADAISAAHQKGITHRDLKPANVMIGADGRVKVLDFGLAKLMDAPSVAMGVTGLPTAPLTGDGRIVGTVAYMSPEQAEGKPVDHRSDIFSLGVMLYEMATGARPFTGNTTVSTITSILRDTPRPITDLNPAVPRDVAKIVRHCLVKDAEHRYQSAKDLRHDLEEVKRDLESGELSSSGIPPVAPLPRHVPRAWLTLGAVAVIGLIVGWWWTSVRPTRRGPGAVEATFKQLTSEPGSELFPSLSPDGRWIVYSGRASGHAAIYLRSVGGQEAFDLTKDSPADDTQPAFSPDGERIAFRSERDGGGLFVMSRTGESVRRLTDFGFNPAWSPTGDEIAFADENVTIYPRYRSDRSKLWAVNVATGSKRLITEGDAVQPSWSPHGDRIVYWAIPFDGSGGGQRDVWTIAARGGSAVRVTDDPAMDWNPVWAPDGKFVYFASDRGGSMNVWRVPIDEPSGTVVGLPEAVTTPSRFVGHLSLSADGRHLAYTSMLLTSNLQRLTFDPVTQTTGREPVAITSGSHSYESPDLSPDDTLVAFRSIEPQEDIFVCRVDGIGVRQLTADAAHDRLPRWSPNGQRIAFYSNRAGPYNIWSIHPDGSGLEPLTDTTGKVDFVWSPDGTRMSAIDSLGPGVDVFDPRVPWHQQQPQRLPAGPKAFTAWSWSPDGKQLAGYLVGHLVPGGGIVTYSFESGTYRTVVDFGKAPMWLNDSESLVFPWRDELFLVHQSDPTHLRELLSVPPDQINDLTISRDNRTIVFTRVVTEADIWLATLK